ncbi:MAG: hypothetical protein ACOCP4_04595, partial [Candidatus Woesearchaeota archaeon]
MEIEKILSIFKELVEEEEKYNVQKELNQLMNHVNAGSSTNVDALLKVLENYAEDSVVNNYAYSKLKLLDKLQAKEYFGIRLLELIKQILTTEGYKTKSNITSLAENRTEFLTNIKNNIKNFEKMQFKPYYEDLADFELGLIIPNSEADIKKVQQHLKDWQFILKTVNEYYESNHEEPKIYSVSNNSIGIFIIGCATTITAILTITNKILDIYERIYELRMLKTKIEKEKINKAIKEIEKREKEIVLEEEKKILEKIKEEKTSGDANRANELENHFSKIIDILIKMQEKGIVIEINPPKIKEPETKETDTEENKKKQDDAKKQYQNKLSSTKKLTELGVNITETM